jgi:hypothetical protein
MPTDAIKSSVTKRSRRIEKRCIAPVIEALHSGQISPRSADMFLRLTPAEQAQELGRRLALAREREARHRLVADAIRTYLDSLNGRQVDLHQLAGIIRQALS